ncbi:unnamed protein product, partial [marine sediment metagenome]
EIREMDGDQPHHIEGKTITIVPSQKPGTAIHIIAKLRVT